MWGLYADYSRSAIGPWTYMWKVSGIYTQGHIQLCEMYIYIPVILVTLIAVSSYRVYILTYLSQIVHLM